MQRLVAAGIALLSLAELAFGYSWEDVWTIDTSSGDVTETRELTGSGSIVKVGSGKLTLSGSSSFTGGVVIRQGEVLVRSGSGLGSGSVTIESRGDGAGGRLSLDCSGGYFRNPIVVTNVAGVMTHDLPAQISFLQPATLAGDITSSCNLYFMNESSGSSTEDNRCTVSGKVVAEGCEVGSGSTHNRNAVVFRGGIVCRKIYEGWSGSTGGKGQMCLASTANAFDEIELKYAGLEFDAANVLPTNVVVHWTGSDENRAGFYLRKGYGQTISSLKCDPGITKVVTLGGSWFWKERPDDQTTAGWTGLPPPVTLTLKAKESNWATCRIVDHVSLVYDPLVPTNCQEIADAVHTTDGSLTVKGGTLRFSGATTLAKLQGIVVDGGTFDLESSLEHALVNVRSVKVAAGATLRVRGDNVFSENFLLSMDLARDAKLDFEAGTSLNVAELKIAGAKQKTGTYSFSGVTIKVGSVQVATQNGEIQIGGMFGRVDGDCVLYVPEGLTVWPHMSLGGTGRLVKTGAGVLVLNQANTYSGGTEIVEGEVVVRRAVSSSPSVFGTGRVTVDGGRLVIEAEADATVSKLPNDFVFTQSSSSASPGLVFRLQNVTAWSLIVIDGKITALADLYVKQEAGSSQQWQEAVHIKMNGGLDAGTHQVSFDTRCGVDWNGPVVAGVFKASESYPFVGQHNFNATGNEIGEMQINHCGQSVKCGVVDALVARVTMLRPQNWSDESYRQDPLYYERRGHLILDGFDQHLAAIDGGAPSCSICYRDFKPVELTLTGGVQRASFAGMLGNVRDEVYNPDDPWFDKVYLSVTVDDAGDGSFVQDFTNNQHITYGTMRVKRGALSFSGEKTTLVNVPAVLVEGGTFSLDTLVPEALKSVTNVAVAAGGVFKVTNRVSDPLSGRRTILHLSSDGRLDLPAGAYVEVKKMYIDGVLHEAGTFSGAGGAGKDVQELPQISGTGILKVNRGLTGAVLLVY